MHDNSIRLDDLMPLIRERLASGESVRFSPHGTSMLPMLKDGRDQVILAPLPDKLKKYDLPLYQRRSGQYVLHRIVNVRDGYTCVGDNQFALEKGLQYDQMIAVMTHYVRKGKVYSAECFRYKVYCRFWHYTRLPRRIWRWMLNRLRRLAGKV